MAGAHTVFLWLVLIDSYLTMGKWVSTITNKAECFSFTFKLGRDYLPFNHFFSPYLKLIVDCEVDIFSS